MTGKTPDPMEADRPGFGGGLYLVPGGLVYGPSFPRTVFLTCSFISFEGIKRDALVRTLAQMPRVPFSLCPSL